MRPNGVVPTFPLPKRWPHRVRSAVVQAISLAQVSLTHARSVASNSACARIRLKEENDRLRQEIWLLREETRIKDTRMEQLPPQRRPHYPPVERLAILELRAARHWSLAQTATRFLVTPLTISSWTNRLDDEGRDALIQLRVPVNRFPEFVGYMVRRLRVLCPTMGKVRIANVLCRAGLHLGTTTVRRMLRDDPKKKPARADRDETGRVVTSRRPNEIWNVDLTTVPTMLGFWVPWIPLSLPLIWPFCWWVAVAIDHYSRRVVGVAVFTQNPSASDAQRFLARVIKAAGGAPKDIITDKGSQFTDDDFGLWCKKRGVRQRFGAVGKYGSIATIERFMRTLKQEGTRQILVPFARVAFERDLSLIVSWYNSSRPHSSLSAGTPDEVFFGRRPACRAPRFEPRAKWPRRSPCTGPHALIRGRSGAEVELEINYKAKRKHLPLVSLKRVA
jgi:transposase InsO family protein